MSAMPWWGWLILACLALFLTAWVAIATISARAMRRMSDSFNARNGRRPGGRR